jgi:hypothetical protein
VSAAGGFCFGDRWRDHVGVFVTEMAALAAVRIEAGDQDARMRDVEALLQIAMDDAEGFHQLGLLDGPGHG